MTGVLSAHAEPADLIEGDPHAARRFADDLRSRGYRVEDLGISLFGVDRSVFRSGAAAEQFPRSVQSIATALAGSVASYHRAASALDDYADAVDIARLRASTAIDTWAAADRLTAAVLADLARDAGRSSGAATSHRPDVLSRATGTGSLQPALDPGTALREEATLLLAAARHLVEEAGDDAATAVDRAGEEIDSAPSFWDQAGGTWSDLWHGAADLGADLGNGIMSFGNALVQHPDLLAELVGGLMLMQGGIALGGGGLALSATGVGALAGVPAEAAAAAAVAAGAALAGQATVRAGIEAAGDDRVQVFNREGDSGGYRSPDAAPEDYPRAVTGYTNHSVERMVQRRSWRQRIEELVDNPPEPPTWQPHNQTWRYKGNDGLTAIVNEFGEVVTVYGG